MVARLFFLLQTVSIVTVTDMIAYIDVPPAVVGVIPTLYAFVSALYTLLKIRQTLRDNGLKGHIKIRLMTGVVDVDLPIWIKSRFFGKTIVIGRRVLN